MPVPSLSSMTLQVMKRLLGVIGVAEARIKRQA
jgi:hypothetical protein